MDKDTYERIYREHYPALCNHAQKLVKCRETAENIVSGFFANLLEKRSEVVIHDSEKGYVHAGVTNACLKYLEHEKVKRKYSDYVQTLLENSNGISWYDNDNPEHMMIEQERMNEINRAIDALPAQYKEVVELKMIGLSYQEIAEKMNIKTNAVGVLINRAIAKIRKTIENAK
jgi:RNA polymerase sigma-70 factor (ECF subfamily)